MAFLLALLIVVPIIVNIVVMIVVAPIGTGKAIIRFILHDLDTNSDIIADDIELIIYGCGDGICELGLENTNSCPGDCQ